MKKKYDLFAPSSDPAAVLASIKDKAKRRKKIKVGFSTMLLIFIFGLFSMFHFFKEKSSLLYHGNVVVKNVTIDEEQIPYTILHLKSGATIILFNHKKKIKEENNL